MTDHYGFRSDLLIETATNFLPRKEVIHPQLPLRMPCYDFTLIIDPTVIPGLTRGFRVLPTLLV